MKDFILKIKLLLFFLREALREWKEDIWDKSLDSPYCCGEEGCACLNESIRSLYTDKE